MDFLNKKELKEKPPLYYHMTLQMNTESRFDTTHLSEAAQI